MNSHVVREVVRKEEPLAAIILWADKGFILGVDLVVPPEMTGGSIRFPAAIPGTFVGFPFTIFKLSIGQV